MPPLPAMARLARVVEQQCALLAQGMPMIEQNNKVGELARIAKEIRALEDQGDTISDEVQRTLYHGVNDVPGMIRAMRGGEIVALIEDASDQAQRVAKTVESILLKNA